MLKNKALQLTGSADSAKPPPGRTVYGWHIAEEHADIFLTYCTNALAACTNALAAQKENPERKPARQSGGWCRLWFEHISCRVYYVIGGQSDFNETRLYAGKVSTSHETDERAQSAQR